MWGESLIPQVLVPDHFSTTLAGSVLQGSYLPILSEQHTHFFPPKCGASFKAPSFFHFRRQGGKVAASPSLRLLKAREKEDFSEDFRKRLQFSEVWNSLLHTSQRKLVSHLMIVRDGGLVLIQQKNCSGNSAVKGPQGRGELTRI